MPPVELLSGFTRPGMVGDGHFDDAVSLLAQFGRHFRAKLKTRAVERDRIQHFATKRLIAGRFVRDARAVKDVGENVQQMNAEEMMKALDLMLGAEQVLDPEF